MCKLMLSMGCIVALAYATEFFMALVQRQPLRAVRVPQPRVRPVWLGVLDHGRSATCWSRSCSGSRSPRATCRSVFVISILLVNVGMWFERFVIIVELAHRDFLPSSWADYRPRSIEIAHAGRQLRPLLHLLPAVLPLLCR